MSQGLVVTGGNHPAADLLEEFYRVPFLANRIPIEDCIDSKQIETNIV